MQKRPAPAVEIEVDEHGPVRLAFQADEEDYVRACKLHHRRLKGPAFAFWILLPVTVLLVVAYWLLFGGGAFIVGATAVLAAVAFAFVLLRIWVVPAFGRKAYRQNKSLQRPVRVEIDEAGLRAWQGEDNQSYLPWEECHRWLEGPSELLIYRSHNLFHVLPKSALGAPDLARVRAMLEARVRRH